MSEDDVTVCELCREPVTEGDPDVIRAFEQVDVTGFGQARETINGLPVLFHEGCYPTGTQRYRRD